MESHQAPIYPFLHSADMVPAVYQALGAYSAPDNQYSPSCVLRRAAHTQHTESLLSRRYLVLGRPSARRLGSVLGTVLRGTLTK